MKREGKSGKKVAVSSGFALVVLLTVLAWASWEGIVGWYHLWTDFESLGENSQGYDEYRHRQTEIVFIRLQHEQSRRRNAETPDEGAAARSDGESVPHCQE